MRGLNRETVAVEGYGKLIQLIIQSENRSIGKIHHKPGCLNRKFIDWWQGVTIHGINGNEHANWAAQQQM
jgi:hypothetical protein